ncbi:hypothetical protein FQA47_008174 [Oryzias melastigma]|uniref:Uncharacterized protein n=1 Tax=Oryzias melastigma TaxID=30732 RepID=A0A834FNL2_ORYME|nr:hypothetical protein FQA47_008174 [Oryzias melastigma]
MGKTAASLDANPRKILSHRRLEKTVRFLQGKQQEGAEKIRPEMVHAVSANHRQPRPVIPRSPPLTQWKITKKNDNHNFFPPFDFKQTLTQHCFMFKKGHL